MKSGFRTLAGVLAFAVVIAAGYYVFSFKGWPVPLKGEFTAKDGRKLRIEFISPTVFQFEAGEPSVLRRLLEPKPEAVRGGRVLDNGFETPDIILTVQLDPLCLQIFDKKLNHKSAEICPDEKSSFQVLAPTITHAYGLGEQLLLDPNLSWVGKKRTPGDDMGNKMVGFENAAVGNAQFPVLYAIGEGKENFAIVFDNIFAQTWDMQKQPWQVSAKEGPVRGFYIAGTDMKDLRRQYMDMAGHSPVPPRKAFGLWLSEYGFDNWQELDKKKNGLKEAGFPVDGFVLDLQWFGGIKQGSTTSGMGGLQWDLKNFPEPAKKIAALKEEGYGIVVIEEPYIAKELKDQETGKVIHEELASKGYLVMNGQGADAKPMQIDPTKDWWGRGGMYDFVQDEAADFWHDWKRQPLIKAGVIGHWTDLGEPEMYDEKAFYDRGKYRHPEVHNIYNLKWSESLFRGYRRNNVDQRLWILSRSGTIGSQRYGVAMWSGDIGSNMESLEATTRAQGHMALSGMDYFGSDTGGFHRSALRGNLNELYSQWFTNAALFDIPLRPHALNLCNCNETSPDRVGYVVSNRAAAELRHELIPYYYSLAHEAQRSGSAIITPLVYSYQDDVNTREIGDHKMIGPFLMGVGVAAENIEKRGVYFPKGIWYDYYNGAREDSKGEWFGDRIVRWEGVIRAPLFAREGALIPTQNARGEIVLKVYPSAQESSFTLWEDDGETNAYLKDERRATEFWQMASEKGIRVRVSAAKGTFKGASETRAFGMEVPSAKQPEYVRLNGEDLTIVPSKDKNFWSYQNGLVKIWLSDRPVTRTEDILVYSP